MRINALLRLNTEHGVELADFLKFLNLFPALFLYIISLVGKEKDKSITERTPI